MSSTSEVKCEDVESSSKGAKRSKLVAKTQSVPLTAAEIEKLHRVESESDENDGEMEAPSPSSPTASPTVAVENRSTSSKKRKGVTSASADGDSDDEQPTKKQKGKESTAAAGDSDSEAARPGDDDEGDGDDGDAGDNDSINSDSPAAVGTVVLMQSRKPKMGVTEVKLPERECFFNPNTTVEYFCKTNRLKVHYTEIAPSHHLYVKVDAKKNAVFTNIKCNLGQKFDWTGGTNFHANMYRATLCTNFIFITPFGLVRNPQVYPDGNLTPLPNPQFPGPTHRSKAEQRLPIYTNEYSAPLSTECPFTVDHDMHSFMSEWWRNGFDVWTKSKAVMKNAEKIWPKFTHSIKAQAEEAYNKEFESYERQLSEWKSAKKGKRGEKPAKPVEKDIDWASSIGGAFRNTVATGENGWHINFKHHLFGLPTKAEADEYKSNPSKAPPALVNASPLFRDMWFKPEPKEDAPGWPRKPVPVVMFHCVTEEERLSMDDKASASPWRLIPFEHSFIAENDVVAVISTVRIMDAPKEGNIRPDMLGIIWLGTKDGIQAREKVPVNSELDPTTYFHLAEKYTRRKGWTPPAGQRAITYDELSNRFANDPAYDSFLSAP